MITDTFAGDDEALCESIRALLQLDAADALVPHGIGGHARTLLAACHERLSGHVEGSTLPTKEKNFSRAIRAPRAKDTCLNVGILGHKDPRGPDNNLRVWTDNEGLLHLRLEKTNRCYQFRRCINARQYIEIIAE